MQKCYFNKIALHRLLLKPDPDHGTGPRKTWTLKNLAHENSGKQVDAKKKVWKITQCIIYYNTKILQEEACIQVI